MDEGTANGHRLCPHLLGSIILEAGLDLPPRAASASKGQTLSIPRGSTWAARGFGPIPLKQSSPRVPRNGASPGDTAGPTQPRSELAEPPWSRGTKGRRKAKTAPLSSCRAAGRPHGSEEAGHRFFPHKYTRRGRGSLLQSVPAQPGCPDLGHDSGGSCSGAKRPKLANITPKFQGPLRSSPPPRQTARARRAQRVPRRRVIHHFHYVNI